MQSQALWKIGWRHLLRRPLQSGLMLLGIVLGVAVVVAVDLANASASRAFQLSAESVSGRATHQIAGGPQGLDEGVYTRMRRSGLVDAAAPVVTAYVSSPQLGDRPLQLVGIDPLADAPFRDYLGTRARSPSGARPSPAAADLIAFLTRPGALLISSGLAQRYGLQACPPGETASPVCTLQLNIAGQVQTAFIAGLLEPQDNLSRRALEGILVADIATAQELTGQVGKLDRIELILPAESEPVVRQIESLLPAGAYIQPVSARSGAIAQMTAAFQVNLTALSLLALVVGMFLIYNTMTFSVIQRRPMFGTLRCLGVSRAELFALVTGEAAIVGIAGAVLGSAAGVLLGQGVVRLVTQTINDLFFVVTVSGVQVPLASLLKGSLLGIGATLLSAMPPAWEAATSPPRVVLSRSGLESKARLAVKIAAAGGVGMALLGFALLVSNTRSLTLSFMGTIAVVVGLALLAPLVTQSLIAFTSPVLGRISGTLGRMAIRDVINSLSRTAVAVAALMLAVSVIIGVSLMVSSFRHTINLWLEQSLQGDIYISNPGPTATTPSAPLDPQVVQAVEAWPGVRRADVQRSVEVDSPQGSIHISATTNFSMAQERTYLSMVGTPDTLWERLQAGGVLITEPLATRLGLPRKIPAGGASITLFTGQGAHAFPVLGVYYDYSTPQGMVYMPLDLYRRWWDDPTITAIALRLEPGIDQDQTARDLQDRLPGRQNLLIRPNRTLRQDVLVVFDRTFAITRALQLLSTLVAFIGVLSAVLSLELERQRELGILRALALTRQQIWRLVLLETGLLGVAAGLLAIPTGFVLSLILIEVINRRSFGWTLRLQVSLLPFLGALGVAILAALLAGIYPAWRTGKVQVAEALHSE